VIRDKLRSDATFARLQGAEIVSLPSFNVTALETCWRGFAPDAIFNLAAYGVNPEDRDHEEMLDGNVGLVTKLVAAAASASPKRFIHTGSCSEYGAPIANETPINEADPVRPESVYGAAKAAATLCGTALARQLHVPFVTLRLFGIFGPGEGPHRLVPYLIQQLQRNLPADLTPGEQVRDLLYVDDVVEALILSAQTDALTPYEAYNVCSRRPVRVREIGTLVADLMHKSRSLLRWGQRPYRRNEAMWIVGDNRRFVEATAWRPRVTHVDGVRRMLDAADHTSPHVRGAGA
jgi:nucleoside-diphosphate-sugar epimerase